MDIKEKEAIKWLFNLRATIDESNMLFDEDINVKCGKETIKEITIILNLIKAQQNELDNKDKIINEMANNIADSSNVYENLVNTEFQHTVEEVIDYFTKKVEGE